MLPAHNGDGGRIFQIAADTDLAALREYRTTLETIAEKDISGAGLRPIEHWRFDRTRPDAWEKVEVCPFVQCPLCFKEKLQAVSVAIKMKLRQDATAEAMDVSRNGVESPESSSKRAKLDLSDSR